MLPDDMPTRGGYILPETLVLPPHVVHAYPHCSLASRSRNVMVTLTSTIWQIIVVLYGPPRTHVHIQPLTSLLQIYDLHISQVGACCAEVCMQWHARVWAA